MADAEAPVNMDGGEGEVMQQPVAAGDMAAGGEGIMESTYEQQGVQYAQDTRRRKQPGFVGAPPSSLAALASGKKYLSDPLSPLTPRPNVRHPPPLLY